MTEVAQSRPAGFPGATGSNTHGLTHNPLPTMLTATRREELLPFWEPRLRGSPSQACDMLLYPLWGWAVPGVLSLSFQAPLMFPLSRCGRQQQKLLEVHLV